jgi:hypothetical protein
MYKAGDLIEVRSKEEILATLDEKAEINGLPFMPEMFEYCGKQFRIYKRAHKTCDTVFPVRGRRVADAVHLNTRCSGMAHGGCQAACLIFWNVAWLKPITMERCSADHNLVAGITKPSQECTEDIVNQNTLSAESAAYDSSAHIYRCQATQLPYATSHLSPWDIRQYVEDYYSKNITLKMLLCGTLYMIYNKLASARTGIGIGRLFRLFYDCFQKVHNGIPYPRKQGLIPNGERTPSVALDLQPGDWVKVRRYEDILATCDKNLINRGMKFDAEMVPYCGGTYQVLKRVAQIIDEKTGKMISMKTPCIILDRVICQGRYSECRLFCPRAIYPYWREIWLERAAAPKGLANTNRLRSSSQSGQEARQAL